MFSGVHIESNFQSQAGVNNLFSQMNDILNHHAPQKEPEYDTRGLHPMISVDQAAKELLELLRK